MEVWVSQAVAEAKATLAAVLEPRSQLELPPVAEDTVTEDDLRQAARDTIAMLHHICEARMRLIYLDDRRRNGEAAGPVMPVVAGLHPARNVLHCLLTPELILPPPIEVPAHSLRQLTFDRPNLPTCGNGSSCLCYRLRWKDNVAYRGPPLNIHLSPRLEMEFQARNAIVPPVTTQLLCLLCNRASIPGREMLGEFNPTFQNTVDDYSLRILAPYRDRSERYVMPWGFAYLYISSYVTNGKTITYVDERDILVGGRLDREDFDEGMPRTAISYLNVQRCLACLPLSVPPAILRRLTADLLPLIVLDNENLESLITWRHRQLGQLLINSRNSRIPGLDVLWMWYDMHAGLIKAAPWSNSTESSYQLLTRVYENQLAPEQQIAGDTGVEDCCTRLAMKTILTLAEDSKKTPLGRLLTAMALGPSTFTLRPSDYEDLLPAVIAMALAEVGELPQVRDQLLRTTPEDFISITQKYRTAGHLLVLAAFVTGADALGYTPITPLGPIASGLSELFHDLRYRRQALVRAWLVGGAGLRQSTQSWVCPLVGATVLRANETNYGLTPQQSLQARWMAAGARPDCIPQPPEWMSAPFDPMSTPMRILVSRARVLRFYRRGVHQEIAPPRQTYGYQPSSVAVCFTCMVPVGLRSDSSSSRVSLSVVCGIRGTVHCSICRQPSVFYVDASEFVICIQTVHGPVRALTECRSCGHLMDASGRRYLVCEACSGSLERLKYDDFLLSHCYLGHRMISDQALHSLVHLHDNPKPLLICQSHARRFPWLLSHSRPSRANLETV